MKKVGPRLRITPEYLRSAAAREAQYVCKHGWRPTPAAPASRSSWSASWRGGYDVLRHHARK